jgi:hypothetical protein
MTRVQCIRQKAACIGGTTRKVGRRRVSKAGKTYRGTTQEGVASAILQCMQQMAACIWGPTRNWGKKGGCSKKTYKGTTQEGVATGILKCT